MSLCLLCGERFKNVAVHKCPEGALSAEEHAQDVQIRVAEGLRREHRVGLAWGPTTAKIEKAKRNTKKEK
jgi:hypothetical protein